MIDIFEVLSKNEKEAKSLLKGKGEVSLYDWDEDEEEYQCGDDGIYIRYADDEGYISVKLVVGVRLNEKNNQIEIITSDSEDEESDGDWFPLNWADDISYHTVLDAIYNLFGRK